MDSNVEPVADERRRGTQTAVNKFVTHRSEMLSLYWKVAGLTPFEDTGVDLPKFSASAERELDAVLDHDDGDSAVETDEATQKSVRLDKFCEVLVDYIAAGHFTLYDRITSGQERRKRTRELAEELYPRIADLTETVIQFSDKYESESEQPQTTDALTRDLSDLGEALATRIELEDKLIDTLS